MPNSVLWAVDLFGKVHTLSTAGQHWELCRDSQLEFKRVSATTQCCWGIACDNQVYVYVCSSDVPIRRREEVYENQVESCGFGRLVCEEGDRPALHSRPSPMFASFILLKVRVVQHPGLLGREPLLCTYKSRLARSAQGGLRVVPGAQDRAMTPTVCPPGPCILWQVLCPLGPS